MRAPYWGNSRGFARNYYTPYGNFTSSNRVDRGYGYGDRGYGYGDRGYGYGGRGIDQGRAGGQGYRR